MEPEVIVAPDRLPHMPRRHVLVAAHTYQLCLQRNERRWAIGFLIPTPAAGGSIWFSPGQRTFGLATDTRYAEWRLQSDRPEWVYWPIMGELVTDEWWLDGDPAGNHVFTFEIFRR